MNLFEKVEGINFGPNNFDQQLLELFRELSDIFTQILLTKGRYIYILVCLLRLRCFFIRGSCLNFRDG